MNFFLLLKIMNYFFLLFYNKLYNKALLIIHVRGINKI